MNEVLWDFLRGHVMSDLENKPETTTESKKTSNTQALMILIIFIVMFVGLVAYEMMTKK